MPIPVDIDIHALLADASGFWEFVVVFFLAMIPAIEPFIVIPVAIGLGLNPVLTGIAAFTGSFTAVTLIVLAHH